MTDHIFVLAGSHDQALRFARGRRLSPGAWTYISSPDQLRGLREGAYLKFGTWYLRKDARDIEQMLAERNMREVEGRPLEYPGETDD